jgi:acyl carrier protein
MEATPNQIPGWDSLGHASLAATLEQVFNVSLDIDDLMAMEDVRSVVEVLQRKLQ